jgi:hypothetical protein|tara:strand:- start:1749 stop:2090 length:342 start_codon:yes stop_codon:yes gene_type:complete
VALRLKNAAAALANTSLTSVYTCPVNFTAVIKEVWVTNIDGSSAANITLQWTDTSASTTYDLLSTFSIAADNYLQLNSTYIVLEAGDVFKAQASAANDLTVSLFIQEELKGTG